MSPVLPPPHAEWREHPGRRASPVWGAPSVRRLRNATCCAVALTGFVTACQPSAQLPSDAGAFDTAGIRASIDTLATKVTRAHETGDAALFASTWARDGIMSLAGSPPVHGRDSIVAAFRRRPPLPPGARMSIHPTEVRILGAEWAYVMGVDTLTHAARGGAAPAPTTFTFLVLLRKTEEGWQTYREVLSAN